MRRYQKKQIQEKFQILYEAHQCVRQLLSENRDATELLEDCQSLAIEIGNQVEQSEGMGTETVTKLEAYCECVYQASTQKFPTAPGVLAASVYVELSQSLRDAESSFNGTIPEETKVVFFPYKASMWDSMETVWRKLSKEENTTCKVVPLPYYIKNERKEKRKKCYEGAEFPKEVPITDYEEFLEEGYFADIAIYHNPYDDTNRLTEVDERFFTSNMHKFADTLVYIPYYVLMDAFPMDFALVPGVKNADYVILQDEEVAREFQRWNPREKEKFLPLGSPKIEKALEMNRIPREDLAIPEEWKERIRGKKVLLYNTHLKHLLGGNPDFINKLKSVFEKVRKYENVVLWWRPHPLSEEMEFLAQTEQFQEYEALIRWYRKENFGIFDDTGNLHEAIAASDAYFGDGSSLVKLFQVVEKPVLLQAMYQPLLPFGMYNSLRLTPEEYHKKCFLEDEGLAYHQQCYDMCTAGKDAWYVTSYNVLFRVNLETGENVCMGQIPGAKKVWGYNCILHYDGQLLLVPFKEKNLVLYDMESGKFSALEQRVAKDCEIIGAYMSGDKAFLVPIKGLKVYIYDFSTGDFRSIDQVERVLPQEQKKMNCLSISSYITEQELMILLLGTNLICRYDLDKETVSTIKLPAKEGGVYREMVSCKEGVFLIDENGHYAVLMDESGNIKKEFFIQKDWIDENSVGFLYELDGDVYYVPILGGEMLCFHLTTGEVQPSDRLPRDVEKGYGFSKVLNGKLCRLPQLADRTLYMEQEKALVLEEEEELACTVQKHLEKDRLLVENRHLILEDYIAYIQNLQTKVM